jgi:hypothetical protein
LLSAYSANKNCVDRAIIEEVADNLDMLPDRSPLLVNERYDVSPVPSSVLTKAGRDELLMDEKSNSKDLSEKKFKKLREV